MKLRIRSTATRETMRIETADSSSLSDLKTLIAAKLSSLSPIDPQSIHLSLNRTDELLPPSPQHSLQSLGLTSGDLLFFSTSAVADETLTLTATAPSNPQEMTSGATQVVGSVPDPQESGNFGPQTLDSVPSRELPNTQEAENGNFNAGTLDSEEGDPMDEDMEPPVTKKPPSVPCLFKRVMEAESGEVKGAFGHLVGAIHAVFLESGFMVYGGNGGSRLPPGLGSTTPLRSVKYTISDLVGPLHESNAKVAVLKFSVLGNFVSVYGFVDGERPDVYRVCFDAAKVVPALVSSLGEMGEREEKEVFQVWKIVKDVLALPLLIDICEKNGLSLPPCFTCLPIDLKIRILEFLPGVDVAKIACTSSELRYLAANDELWKMKFSEDFGLLDERGIIGSSWKDKFGRCWMKKKAAYRRTDREIIYRRPRTFVPRYTPFPSQGFPMIGGDYDMTPGGAPFGLQGPRIGFLRSTRRNFSPRCNLGGRDTDFSM